MTTANPLHFVKRRSAAVQVRFFPSGRARARARDRNRALFYRDLGIAFSTRRVSAEQTRTLSPGRRVAFPANVHQRYFQLEMFLQSRGSRVEVESRIRRINPSVNLSKERIA